MVRHLQRVVRVEEAEVPALLWSFLYFFALLSSYYVLRPVREEMGISGGIGRLPWLYSATFVTMLLVTPAFGAAVARLPRRSIIPAVYRFASANLLLFALLVGAGAPSAPVANVFFVWLSVFNLLVVSVFWSFMADVFTSGQARRLFGFIAAGGSAGALLGPLLAGSLARPLGAAGLFLVAAALLEGAVQCVRRLGRRVDASRPDVPDAARPIGGSALAGIRLVLASPYLLAICLQTLLFTTASTFLYLEQARIVSESLTDAAARTSLFAGMDLAVNATAIVLQALVAGRVLAWAGVGVGLALVPALTLAGFTVLAALPWLAVVVVFQVVRRSVHHGIERPSRENLFTVVGEEPKYKSKSFIDTVVYRGGDAASGWAHAGVGSLALGAPTAAIAMIPVALASLGVAAVLGREARVRAERTHRVRAERSQQCSSPAGGS